MHSSRMLTDRSSSRLLGGRLPQCMLGYPPGVGLETPLPHVWAWRPPRPDPSTSPLGVGLETYKEYWDTNPPPSPNPPETCMPCWDTTCNACWDTTHPLCTEFLTHTTENATLPQTSFAGGNERRYQ